MKKVFRRDFRRETQEILNSLQMTDEQIADKLGTSARSITRWRSGVNSPQPSQFQRLKALAEGKLSHLGKGSPDPAKEGEEMDVLHRQINTILTELMDIRREMREMRGEINELKIAVGKNRGAAEKAG